MLSFKFPKNFYWGAATSSHQVEGGNLNDWSEWEKKNATRLAKEAGLFWQKWQQKKFPEMFKAENYLSGLSCDHYHLFREDFEIAKNLNHNAHRFSLEWSRLEPKKGSFNEKEIGHYRQVVEALCQKGIEPFLTVWHWTNPLWIRDLGGWENQETVDYFSDYLRKVVSSLREQVKFWIVLNEPMVFSSISYKKGSWPPQKRSFFSHYRVIKNLISAHRRAYRIIKEIDPRLQVGIAKNNVYFEAYRERLANRVLKKVGDWWWNYRFLDKIKDSLDFIGINYYHHNRINFGFNKNENKAVSDLGWEIYPKGIYYLLREVFNRYKKPIFITENGVADKGDRLREKFIRDHLYWLSMALGKGVDVRGYFYWSLLDNFEWDKGFWPRFGLVEVDYKTQKRRIRPSAIAYAEMIKNLQLDS